MIDEQKANRMSSERADTRNVWNLLELEVDEGQVSKILGSYGQLEVLPDASYGVILCHNVLEYIAPQERSRYLRQLKRLPRGGASCPSSSTIRSKRCCRASSSPTT